MKGLFSYLKHKLNSIVEPTPPQKKDIDTVNPDVYRFGGDRYSMNNASAKGPSDIVRQNPGNYTCPRDN